MSALRKLQQQQSRPRGIPICTRCDRENDRPSQGYCSGCHAAYMREWRKTHPLSEDGKKRDSARSYASEYKKRGLLVAQPCKICGAGDTEMHHPDHELPLMVVWLCRGCHLAWHSFWRDVVTDAWAMWISKTLPTENAPRETNSGGETIDEEERHLIGEAVSALGW